MIIVNLRNKLFAERIIMFQSFIKGREDMNVFIFAKFAVIYKRYQGNGLN